MSDAQPTSRPLRAWILIASVIFASATGPIVIREAQLVGIPSLQIIFFRLVATIVILAPLILRRHRDDFGRISTRDKLFLLIAGVFFAANLILLFFSLEYTSVLVVGVLRRTSPLWLVGLEIVLLGAYFRRELWVGLIIVLVASVVVGFDSSPVGTVGTNPRLGAGMALVGALCIGVYLLVGRALTNRVNGMLYSWLVFSASSVVILIFILASGDPWISFSWQNVYWIGLVTLVTQFMGQIPINLALHYFPATVLSIMMQLGIVASAVLAYLAYDENPTLVQIFGGIAILFGVYLITKRPRVSAETNQN